MSDDFGSQPLSPEEQRDLDEWSAARECVISFFEEHGLAVSNYAADPVLVADDMIDALLVEVEAGVLSVLQPEFVDAFRRRLSEFPDFFVTLQILNKQVANDDWPSMGLILYKGQIRDGLRRDYLPAPFNSYIYSNSRPEGRPDLPFV